ncbi:hypothetical protein TNCV_4272651 [Trichonephila clavipes]|nr:hypothetical protein TNCV_4272651 [Trichonephila clavipes]
MSAVALWSRSRIRGQRVKPSTTENLPCRGDRSTLNLPRLNHPPVGLVENLSIFVNNAEKNLSVQEPLAVFEELPSDDDSTASNNSDSDEEDYVENVAQGKNISSDDEEINEMQCASTSQPENVQELCLQETLDLLQNLPSEINDVLTDDFSNE